MFRPVPDGAEPSARRPLPGSEFSLSTSTRQSQLQNRVLEGASPGAIRPALENGAQAIPASGSAGKAAGDATLI